MSYDSKYKRDDIDELFDAILTLNDREDCYRFFEDICTVNEIHAIAQRLQVAKLLSAKRILRRRLQQRSAESTNAWFMVPTAISEFWIV